MGEPVEEVLRGAWPRPAHSCTRALTTLRNNMANLAARMLPSRLRNGPVPPLPTTEAMPLNVTAEMTAEQRQDPPSFSISDIKDILKVLGWVALGALLTLFLVYKRVACLMKWGECVDETDERNKTLQTEPAEKTKRPRQSGKCVLPDYPMNGRYIIRYDHTATPGESFEFAMLTIMCLPGFRVLGNENIYCGDGKWSASMPKCVRFCKLDNHTSVRYQCQVNGTKQGLRDCNDYEPSGTVVVPECNSPNYYSPHPLPFMKCNEGSWNYVAVCSPECGRVTPNGESLVIGGRSAKRGELPWHVGIYTKKFNPYKQICGGSIVSNRLVISAAHCFWDDVKKQMPASLYAVAAGKIYRPWNNIKEKDAQKSDVKEIMIPARFQGRATNFQDDIALLILVTPFEYRTFIRPICLNFDLEFDQRQLQPGNFGTVAGWGLTSENNKVESQILKVVELPYVNITECIAASPPSFREFITSDKMCAGFGNGTALCKGDSGGGLVFPESDRGTDRYYLRGIVSVAAHNGKFCNGDTLTAFTQILIHEHFVMEYLS